MFARLFACILWLVYHLTCMFTWFLHNITCMYDFVVIALPNLTDLLALDGDVSCIFVTFPMLYSGSGMVLGCIVSWSLPSFLLWMYYVLVALLNLYVHVFRDYCITCLVCIQWSQLHNLYVFHDCNLPNLYVFLDYNLPNLYVFCDFNLHNLYVYHDCNSHNLYVFRDECI